MLIAFAIATTDPEPEHSLLIPELPDLIWGDRKSVV